jgi:RNA polymerase sigma-54 factor
MSLSLALRQSAQLTMTPLLQRSIQLLQLSNQEFHQQVLELVDSNPFLETADAQTADAEATDAIGTAASLPSPSLALDGLHHDAGGEPSDAGQTPFDDLPDREREPEMQATDSGEGVESADAIDEMRASLENESESSAEFESAGSGDFDGASGSGARPEDELQDPWSQIRRPTSLREHLREQAGCLRLSARDRMLVESIIDAIDEGGYLRTSLEELAELCPVDPAPEDDELRIALRHVQSMDPPGIGARDVSECLLLQLQAQAPDTCDPDVEREASRQLAMRLVSAHLRELAQHDFQGLQRTLGCSSAELQAAVKLLRSLVPRPGSAFDSESTQFVVADVIVRKRGHRWVATINPEVIPRVRLHRQHVALMRRARDADSQITQCVKEARWLVRNVHQRFQTIQQVAQAIVDHQSRYFDYGDMAMKPLTLAEIAQRTDMHESTVSRVTSRKFMATPRGLLEFKHFFGSHVSTAAGTPCSATAVRAVIQTLVESEDPQAPLSDIRLTRLLEQRGIQVARRTVSKYRDALRIPPVEMRRITAP